MPTYRAEVTISRSQPAPSSRALTGELTECTSFEEQLFELGLEMRSELVSGRINYFMQKGENVKGRRNQWSRLFLSKLF